MKPLIFDIYNVTYCKLEYYKVFVNGFYWHLT